MVEELKLAIKIDDDAIEQSLLKQFNNAEKMADKVVLTFKNINLDDKNIEAKFKEMQKMAGKNPIDFSISDKSVEMLSAISKQLSNIFEIAKGKSLIDSSSTVSDIGKIANATNQQIDAVKKTTSAYKNQAYELASVLKMLEKMDKFNEVSYAGSMSKAVKANAKSYKKDDIIQFSSKDYNISEEALKQLRGLSVNLEEAFNYSDTLGLDTATIKNVEVLIQYFRELLKEKLEFNNTKLNTADIEELIKALGIAKKEVFDDGTGKKINSYDGYLNKYSSVSEIISFLKQQEQQILATAEAEQKLANVEQQSSNSSLAENQNKIQQELKETEKVAEQTAEALEKINSNGDKSNISSGNSTIEDVFQNEKVEQATTSAKELDKTLEQINIPTDSFDDVLSKLDLAKSELKDIVKITKQSVSDTEGKFHDSYTLKDSRGSTEIYGLSSNTEKGQLLRSNIVQYDVKDEEQEAKEIQKAWDNAEEAITEYLKAKTKLNTLEATDIKSGNVKDQIDAQKQKVEKLEVEAENARKVLSNLLGSQDIDTTTWNNFLKLMKDFEEAGKGSSQSIAKIKDAIANVNTSELQSLEKYIESAQKKLNTTNASRDDSEKSLDFKNYVSQAQKYIDDIIAEKQRLESALESGDIEIIDKSDLADIDDLKQKLANLNLEYKTMFKGSAEISRWKEIDTITKYMEKNTRISKEAKIQLQGFIEELKTKGADANVEKIHQSFLEVCDVERKARREGQSFLDVLRDKVWYQWAAQIGTYFSFNDIINYGKQAASIVTELNTQITDLAKVSEATSKQIYTDFDSYADIAKDIGGTISDTISATADWSRNGYSIPDSKELAEVALLYKNVSDGIDIDEANESLISTLRGFKMEAEEAIDIIDIFNEVDILASYYSNVIALCA